MIRPPPSSASRSCGSVTRGKTASAREPLAARDVLEAAVGAPQRGDRRQHDQRVVGERAHEHGAPEAVHAVVEPDPGVAVDELGHRERQREQRRPRACAPGCRCARAARRRPRRSTAQSGGTSQRRARACCAGARRRAAAAGGGAPCAQPALEACTRTNASGSSRNAAIGSASSQQRGGTEPTRPCRPRRSDPAPCAHRSRAARPAAASERGLAVAELRRAHAGRRRVEASGRRPCASSTPEPSGYS